MTVKSSTLSRQLNLIINDICDQLKANKPVRRKLLSFGRIHIDRKLPFLFIFRKEQSVNDKGIERLLSGEASYVIFSAEKEHHKYLKKLIISICDLLSNEFNSCLLIELWSNKKYIPDKFEQVPGFKIISSIYDKIPLITPFQEMLTNIKLTGHNALVKTLKARKCCQYHLPTLLPAGTLKEKAIHLLGIEVDPIYLNLDKATVYPQLLRLLNRRFTLAMQRAVFKYVSKYTSFQPDHFYALGNRAIVKAVWEVDQSLSTISDNLEFLLQVTPINVDSAWNEFRKSRYKTEPEFFYRPLPADPLVLKRKLYKTPVERIEDPALSMIFREKVNELDRMIGMLQDRNTKRFVHASIQLYGDVDDSLHEQAINLLQKLSPRAREQSKIRINSSDFAEFAKKEINRYQNNVPSFSSKVTVREDVTGLIVSNGNLHIGSEMKIPQSRIEALLNHEIGTHVLTYHNGQQQRLKLLHSGLTGYDALQEGLAVLAEYLVNGLSQPRLRLLAGRVVCVKAMLDGATFPEAFTLLYKNYKFSKNNAFNIVVRVYRGGGLTKDAVYLKGLIQILRYLKNSGELKPLFIGKIGFHHISVVRELQCRGVLSETAVMPQYLQAPNSISRLEKLRHGMDVYQLCTNSGKTGKRK